MPVAGVAMSGFSGAVKLGDLDDFINPSQSCVVALNGDKLDLGAAELAVPEGGEMLLRKRGVPSAASPPETPVVRGAPLPSAPGEAVKVSLSDCLACSGCVTSAETVLLEAQSAEAFKRALREASEMAGASASALVDDGDETKTPRRKIRAVVVTVAPQSRASLARVAGLSALEAAQRLTGFFKSIGVARVLDAAAARDVSLLETGEEFVAAWREANESKNNAVSEDGHQETNTVRLPLLTSACPGFVCYAEKTHGTTLLKHISGVKSPQAVMGTVVKSIVAEALGVAPDELFHATVMPCFDKKLEASRADFSISSKSSGDTNMSFTTQETDCVLTTGEVAQLIADAAEASGGVADRSAFGADAAARGRAGAAALARAPRAALDGWLACAGTSPGTSPGTAMDTDCGDARTTEEERSEFLYAPSVPGGGGGSGGYLDYTFRRAALTLFGVSVEGPLPFTTPRLKNPDLREVTLEVGGKTVLRFAAAYGFRNIQNVVRKCKAGAAFGGGGDGYDFVEIMACPSGCLNGGGQLPPPPAFEPGFRLSERAPLPTTLGGTTAKALVDELEELYHTGGLRARGIGVGVGAASCVAREPSANRDVAAMYEKFVRGDVGSARAKAMWHTRYHDRSAEAAMSAGGTAAAAANLKITSDW